MSPEDVVLAISVMLWSISISLLFLRFRIPNQNRPAFYDAVKKMFFVTMIFSLGSLVFMVPDDIFETILEFWLHHVEILKILVMLVLWAVAALILWRLLRSIYR